jgi:hypothetical protein
MERIPEGGNIDYNNDNIFVTVTGSIGKSMGIPLECVFVEQR